MGATIDYAVWLENQRRKRKRRKRAQKKNKMI